ncbi:hypothetical protein ACTG9Q_31270 [Actinokineospora sp. 24-640]
MASSAPAPSAAPDPAVWNVLREAESAEDLVLAADFPVTGRNEGGFLELVPGLGLDCAVWQTVAPKLAPGCGVSTEDYLAPWLDAVTASGRRVRAVLGYCAGSVFAGALAQRVARAQGSEPVVVVFDPELVDVPTVHLQFGRVVGNMTTVLSEDEAASLAATAEKLAEDRTATPAEFAAELHAEFRPVGITALRRAGMDEDYAGELVDLVGSFMTYLGVAAALDPRPGWSKATVFTSTSPRSGLNRMRATPGIAEIATGDEVRVEVEHRDLLRDPAAAEAVSRLLAPDAGEAR